MRDIVLFFLMIIGIVNVVASTALVIINVISPLSFRFNISFLAIICAFCAVNISIFYGWI